MTTIDFALTHAGRPSRWSWQRLWRFWQFSRAAAAERRQLRQLDQRTLDDLGISRSDALAEASRSAFDLPKRMT